MANLFKEFGIENEQKSPKNLFEVYGEETEIPESKQSQMEELAKQYPTMMAAGRFAEEHPTIYNMLKAITPSNAGQAINFAAQKTPLRTIEELGNVAQLPQIGGGILQSVGNAGLSIGNLAATPFTGKAETAPYLDLQQYLPPEKQGDIGFTGGQIAGSLLPITAGARFLEAARPRGYMGILSDVLRGGTAGYALGGEGDNRMLGAAIGGPGGYLLSNTASRIANRISGDKTAIHQAFRQQYNNLFHDAEEMGVEQIGRIPFGRNQRRALRLGTTQQERASFYDYLRDPTLENANRAQSDMGRIYREFQRRSRSPNGLNATERSAMEQAIHNQRAIVNRIENTLNDVGGEDLAQQYRQIRNDYRDYAVPYDDFKALGEYEQHRRSPGHAKKFLKQMVNPEDINALDFAATAGEHYPEAQFYDFIKRALRTAGTTGIGLGAGWMGLRGLSEFRRNH